MAETELEEQPAPAQPSQADEWPVPHVDCYGPRNGPLAWTEYFAARALFGTLGRLPRAPQAWCVGLLARALRRLDRRHSAAARVLLTQALGSLPRAELEARVLTAWRHLLSMGIEFTGFERHLDRGRLERNFSRVLDPEVRALFESSQGVILVGPHLGNWEAFTVALPWLGLSPAYVIGKPPKNRPLSAFIQRRRESFGVRMLPRRGAMQHAPQVIAAGGCLGLVLDQRARKKPVIAPFFGRLARCDRSAGVLLRRLRAPVVFVACYRGAEPFQFRIETGGLLRPEDLAGLEPEAIAGKINQHLERMILRAPEQYFWLHDRYRGAPQPDNTEPDNTRAR